MYEDKILICKDCRKEFIFSAGEQQFYAEKGFDNEPLRCKECRQARKEAAKSAKPFFITVCCDCGGEAKVRFEPKEGRGVRCSACYEKFLASQANEQEK